MNIYHIDRISVVDKYCYLWYNYFVHSSNDTQNKKGYLP